MSIPQRYPSIDPHWTFEEMITNVNGRYYPGGISSGPARSAVIEAWAVAVGGTRASSEAEQYIKKVGSKTAAAKGVKMSSDTFAGFRELFRTLPDPPEVIREGLVLFFSEPLLSVDRWLVDAVVLAVLGKDTRCRLVEIVDQDSTYMLRFSHASKKELQAIGDVLWQRAWRQKSNRLHAEDGVLSTITNDNVALDRLDVIRDLMGYMELRSPSSSEGEIVGLKDAAPIRLDQLEIKSWGTAKELDGKN